MKRARRGGELADALGRMSTWTIYLYFGSCLLALWFVAIGERAFAVVLVTVTLPGIWLAGALTGLTLLIGIPSTLWLARSHRAFAELAYRKHYPPGCTCIFGALTDNPSCPIPEHRSTL